MNRHPMERAFVIARSGECKNMVELERRLKTEDFSSVSEHLSARSLRRQLQSIMKASARS